MLDIILDTGKLIVSAVIGGGIGGAIVRSYFSRKHYSYKYFEDRKREFAAKVFQAALEFQGVVTMLHSDLLDANGKDWSTQGKDIERLKNNLSNAILQSAIYFEKELFSNLMDAIKVTSSVIQRMSRLEASKKAQGFSHGYDPTKYIEWYDNDWFPWLTDQMKAILGGASPSKKIKFIHPPTVGSLRIGKWP